MADIVAPDIVKRLSGIIDNSEVVTVVTHTRPDGDAVGSAVAAACYLRECRKKDVQIIFVNEFPEALDFVADGSDKVLFHNSSPEESVRRIAGSDLIICLDFNDFSRTDGLRDALEASDAGFAVNDGLVDVNITTKDGKNVSFSCRVY